MAGNTETVLGIDLGTTNACVAVFRNGHSEAIPDGSGKKTTPTYVAFHEEGRIYGSSAKQCSFADPSNTIFSIKRIIGKRFDEPEVLINKNRWPFNIVDMEGHAAVEVTENGVLKVFKPEEISAMILRRMKDIAETYLTKAVNKAVITVPANFTDSQRKATKRAGALAGLNVLAIINEPTAAAVAYGLHEIGEKTIMVIDFGGGTLDVSILKITDGRSFEVLTCSGDLNLGGDDFDDRIIQRFKAEFEEQHAGVSLQSIPEAMSRLRLAAENAKIGMSNGRDPVRFTIDYLDGSHNFISAISVADFEELCSDLFEKVRAPVEDALTQVELTQEDIDQIVMVGGTSRLPQVQRVVRSIFPEQTIHRDIHPDEAIACGAAVYGYAIQSTIESSPELGIKLIEKLPKALGVEVLGGWMATVVQKNTTIPCRKSEIFSTAHNYSPWVQIRVYEGDGRRVVENHLLDDMILSGIKIAPAGVPQIEVVFEYDSDGILKVTAMDSETHETARVSIGHRRTSELPSGNVAIMLEAGEEERSAAKNELRALIEELNYSENQEILRKLQDPHVVQIRNMAFSAELRQKNDYDQALASIRSMRDDVF